MAARHIRAIQWRGGFNWSVFGTGPSVGADMASNLDWKAAAAPLALALSVMAATGCATDRLSPPAAAVQRIESASSSLDHDAAAALHEGRAAADAAAAARHLGYAAVYRRNISPRSGPQEHAALARHCENLARAYQQAADENTALAKLHRDLAAAAK